MIISLVCAVRLNVCFNIKSLFSWEKKKPIRNLSLVLPTVYLMKTGFINFFFVFLFCFVELNVALFDYWNHSLTLAKLFHTLSMLIFHFRLRKRWSPMVYPFLLESIRSSHEHSRQFLNGSKRDSLGVNIFFGYNKKGD